MAFHCGLDRVAGWHDASQPYNGQTQQAVCIKSYWKGASHLLIRQLIRILIGMQKRALYPEIIRISTLALEILIRTITVLIAVIRMPWHSKIIIIILILH